ncbi:MAG: transcriptional regulator [Caldilineaceae bacterium]
MGAILVNPIYTEDDHEAALREIERLWNAEPGTPDGERLDVLFTLVEAYEQEHFPILPPDPIDMIEFVMDQRGLSPKDLIPFLGSRSKVSEVLNRRRPLSLEMIRKLQVGLGIRADILVQPYEVKPYSSAA